jgi:hypothetical protein
MKHHGHQQMTIQNITTVERETLESIKNTISKVLTLCPKVTAS